MNIADIPFAWARRELDFPGTIRRGDRGQSVRQIQEWLHYHGFATTVDGAFGPATELSIRDFQREQGLRQTGLVDSKTFAALIQPMRDALQPIAPNGRSYPELVLAYAKQHIAQRPIELGGENGGPWVRLYAQGHEGPEWAWCAGFVSFLLKQAAQYSDFKMPLAGSLSCDSLAAQAKAADRFIRGNELDTAAPPAAACIFLVRRTSSDWTHTGFVSAFEDAAIRTIEGNTNDSGSRDGFEAIARARGYVAKDYIVLD